MTRPRYFVSWHYAGVTYRREIRNYERALRVAEMAAATGAVVVMKAAKGGTV